jgi:hypothetical protein
MADREQEPGEELAADVEAVHAASQTGVAGRIRNWFLTGLVVAGPLAVTTWLIWTVVKWADDAVRPFIPPAYRPETYLPWPIPGTGLVVAFLALTLLGSLPPTWSDARWWSSARGCCRACRSCGRSTRP